jgi:lincosamide nucleotidyltransferase A/C/D/E
MTEKLLQKIKKLKTTMTASDVMDLYVKLDNTGIKIWIDGGWGVDALLGEETRTHEDIDIVIQKKDLLKLRRILKRKGYKDIEQFDTTSWNFILGNNKGHKVDVHVIVFDVEGNGIYGPLKKGNMYPAASLSGTGIIDGHTVRCISPEYMVKFHTGYKLRDSDFQDVLALCERFGIDCPKKCLKMTKETNSGFPPSRE